MIHSEKSLSTIFCIDIGTDTFDKIHKYINVYKKIIKETNSRPSYMDEVFFTLNELLIKVDINFNDIYNYITKVIAKEKNKKEILSLRLKLLSYLNKFRKYSLILKEILKANNKIAETEEDDFNYSSRRISKISDIKSTFFQEINNDVNTSFEQNNMYINKRL